MDSGATRHMTPDIANLQHSTPYCGGERSLLVMVSVFLYLILVLFVYHLLPHVLLSYNLFYMLLSYPIISLALLDFVMIINFSLNSIPHFFL